MHTPGTLYSLTPRLVLVGCGSLLALLVLVFLLGMEVGRLSVTSKATSPATSVPPPPRLGQPLPVAAAAASSAPEAAGR